MIVVVYILVLTRKGKELKAPRHASAAAICNNMCLIPDTYKEPLFYIVT